MQGQGMKGGEVVEYIEFWIFGREHMYHVDGIEFGKMTKKK